MALIFFLCYLAGLRKQTAQLIFTKFDRNKTHGTRKKPLDVGGNSNHVALGLGLGLRLGECITVLRMGGLLVYTRRIVIILRHHQPLAEVCTLLSAILVFLKRVRHETVVVLLLRFSPVVVGGRDRGEADDQDGRGGEDRTADRHQGDAPVLGDDRHRPPAEAAGDGAAVQAAAAATGEVRVHRAPRVAAERNEDGSAGTYVSSPVRAVQAGLLKTWQ